jgi:hypothetical protein
MVLCDASDFANAAAEAAAKKSAQRHALGIADGCGDFIDGGAARFEHMHGLLDAEILEIGQRSLAERIADMPRQGALARGERAGSRAEDRSRRAQWVDERPARKMRRAISARMRSSGVTATCAGGQRCDLGQNVLQHSHAALAVGPHGEDLDETHRDAPCFQGRSSSAREGAITPSSSARSGRTRARTRVPMSTPRR